MTASRKSLNCVAIIENYELIVTTLIKKLVSIIAEIPFSLSNSVPGRSSAFMFELCPNYRGTQSQASNSLSYVIGSIDAVLLMGLFHSLKNVVESGGISPY